MCVTLRSIMIILRRLWPSVGPITPAALVRGEICRCKLVGECGGFRMGGTQGCFLQSIENDSHASYQRRRHGLHAHGWRITVWLDGSKDQRFCRFMDRDRSSHNVRGLNAPTDTTTTPSTLRGVYSFSSKHSGVVQFAFCDGSVHRINAGSTATIPASATYATLPPPASPNPQPAVGGTVTIPPTDWHLFQMLAGYADGENFDASNISP